MFTGFSQRVLPVLQLTRMALVFTAISNAYCTIILLWSTSGIDESIDPPRWLSMTAVSVGLYGFGMSLNDIIDRRRDQQISPNRPLPSGRVDVVTAHLICGLLALFAIVGGAVYAHITDDWLSMILVVFSGTLIVFYDLAGKYLVWPGLLTLGLIRFFHSLTPAPQVPVLWHPLLLLNHVTILSTLAYVWEEKRPSLRRNDWMWVCGGLAFVDVLVVALVFERRGVEGLHLTPWLLLPGSAMVLFVVIVWMVWRASSSSREAGQRAMLYGLLWLIVYDVTFVWAYSGLFAASLMLLFLPVAYFSVQLMRWWAGVVAISSRPEFKRA